MLIAQIQFFCRFRSKNGSIKCINKECVTPPPQQEIPSEYLKTTNGNHYYVSQEELPWAQAQYECLARKGYLAELSGN